MQIKIRKPEIKRPSFGRKQLKRRSFTKSGLLMFFYDQEKFVQENFPIKFKRLVLSLIVMSTITFLTYFLSNFIRVDEDNIVDMLRYVGFLNYGLWLALMLYVVGINVLIVAVLKLLKIEFGISELILNQTFIAAVLFLFMRIVSATLILLDELLPFDIAINRVGLNFNLLTVLFMSQIWVVLVVYNFWNASIKKHLKERIWLNILMSVVYCAVIWTLVSP